MRLPLTPRARAVILGVAGLLTVPEWSTEAQARQANQPQPPDERGAFDRRGDVSPAEVQRLFDAYVMMRAQEMLGLTDSQYPKFLSNMKALQQIRRERQRERNQIIQDLNRLTRPDTPQLDEAAVRERIKGLQDLESRTAADLRRAYDAIDQVLDIGQQGRFRVFEEQMERRKFDLIARARGNRPNKRNPTER